MKLTGALRRCDTANIATLKAALDVAKDAVQKALDENSASMRARARALQVICRNW